MSITNMVKEYLFNFLQFLVNCFQGLVLRLTGKDKLHRQSYETSAQVFQILCRHKSEREWEFSSKNDFISIHERFCHPNIVLSDNISLYTLTTTEAVFVDSDSVNIFDPRHVFVYNGQFKYASRMIILPLASFHFISKQISIPKIPVIHLANHGRCGSTLLSKLFEAIPGTLSISETNPFTVLAEFSRKGELDQPSLKKLLKSVVMCTLKHANDRESKVVFIKCQNIAVYITDLFFDALPFVKQMYMYRQPVKFVQSYEKLEFANNWDPITAERCLLWSGIGCNRLLETYPAYTVEFTEKLRSFARWSLVWITSSAAFNNLVEKGYDIKSLKFEDLLNDPKQVLKALFEFTGVSSSNMPDIDSVLGQDSQAGTPFSSRNVDKKELELHLTPITSELQEEVNKLCEDFNVSEFWQDDLHLSNKL